MNDEIVEHGQLAGRDLLVAGAIVRARCWP
jgi:hypothetical protein